MNWIKDGNNMLKVKKTAIKLPTKQGTHSLKRIGVNLTGRSAGRHPGQCNKNLWVKHTTMVDQGQIISWVKEGVVKDLVIGEKMAKEFVTNVLYLYREYRQYPVQLDTVVAKIVADQWEANLGVAVVTVRDSVDKQKFKNMRDFSPFYAHKLHKKSPGGVPRIVNCWFVDMEHLVSLAMAAKLFLGLAADIWSRASRADKTQ